MDDRFLSRGKLKTDNLPHKKGDWVFGHFVILKDGDRDIPFIYGFGEIIPETLGGCTSLIDKNSKRIFEGDIIRASNDIMHHIGIIRYGEYKFPWGDEYNLHIGFYVDFFNDNLIRNDLGYWLKYAEIEVIGNIYDNKQMLERANMPASNDVFQPLFQPVLKSAALENFELMQG